MKFSSEEATPICGKGTITIDDKHKINDVYYIKGLRHNLLSMIQMCSKGYKLIFHGSRLEIKKGGYMVQP